LSVDDAFESTSPMKYFLVVRNRTSLLAVVHIAAKTDVNRCISQEDSTMKKVLISVALLLFVCTSIAMAQPPGGRGQRMPFDPNKMAAGEVKKIDATAMTFDVERTNRETNEVTKDTIYCTEKTTYKKDGNDAKFADFIVGDRIRATGDRKDGKFMADTVMSMRMPQRPPSE
jgi:Ni/Co efflux regulator RcnB